MTAHILDKARLFLINSLQSQRSEFESRHPWRRDWEFAVLHSMRVETYTTRILSLENHSLSEHEVILLRLAAILHDIHRLKQREQHAKLGAEVTRTWLKEFSGAVLSNDDVERVVAMIADHSNKDDPEHDYSKAVVKDADTLDEIGMMSIFMAANWVNMQSPLFFYELRQRLMEVEIPYCDHKLEILNTTGAKEILKQRKAFIENFVAQITDELQADQQIEQMLLKLSSNNIKVPL
jgi:uncharacterized protein